MVALNLEDSLYASPLAIAGRNGDYHVPLGSERVMVSSRESDSGYSGRAESVSYSSRSLYGVNRASMPYSSGNKAAPEINSTPISLRAAADRAYRDI